MSSLGGGGCVPFLFSPSSHCCPEDVLFFLMSEGETITLYIAHKIFLQLYSLIKGLLGLESLAVTGLAGRDHRQGENTPVSWRSMAAHCVYGPSGTPSMSRVR